MLKELKNWVVFLLFLVTAFLIPKPKSKRIMEVGSLSRLLKLAFGEKCHLFLVDQLYTIPTLKIMQEFLKEDKTDLFKYLPEWFDCDDFSFRLMGQLSIPGWSDIAFGIATSTVHAYNCVVASDNGKLGVYIIEPQTDDLVLAEKFLKETNKAYQTVFVMM